MKGLYFISHNRKFLFLLCTALFVTDILAQVHIGSESPPHASAMLEISATDKGVLFPSVALTAINDASMIVNKKPVDGLLVFNTTENPSLNLYKGMYAWNSVKNLWENIVSDRSFYSTLSSHFAIEKTYLTANILGDISSNPLVGQEMKSSDPVTLVTFNSGVNVNKDNCFNENNNTFTVPESGYYKIACGIEVYVQTKDIANSDSVALQLLFSPPNSSKEEEIISAKITRTFNYKSNLYIPLTPSVIYNGHLEKGGKITVKADLTLAKGNLVGYIIRKYLCINILIKTT
jgi:hypothetical protein